MVEGGVEFLQRLIEVVMDNDAIVPRLSRSAMVHRRQNGDRATGAGNDDAFAGLDASEKPGEVSLGLMHVDGHVGDYDLVR